MCHVARATMRVILSHTKRYVTVLACVMGKKFSFVCDSLIHNAKYIIRIYILSPLVKHS